MQSITISQALTMIGGTAGQTFGIEFIKRTTNERRVMSCRLGVRKGVTGVGLAFNPASKGLLGVFDMNSDGFRFVNIEGVQAVTVAGERFAVTH